MTVPPADSGPQLSPSGSPRRWPEWWRAALLCAVVLTAANATKPIVIDDPVYIGYARQALAHPSDPYGFEFYWYDAPEPAMVIGTVPAVFPYWLAGAMALGGDSPTLWKLSLLPFALALTGSLGFLLVRFARPLTTSVLCVLALGPSVLPSFSLMLDIPAIALGLLGVCLCTRACERRNARLALGAGLVLGLAMQTKYSAAVYPAVALVFAMLARRPREGVIAVLTAAVLFIGWEALLYSQYGQSHFLAGIDRVRAVHENAYITREDARASGTSALFWTLSLLSLLGGTAPFAGLIALVGLGARRWAIAGAALVIVLALASIAVFPLPPAFEASGFIPELFAYSPEFALFVLLGYCLAVCIGVAAARLLRAPGGADRRLEIALVAWLLIELAGYFVISPHPAVRRVIGLGVAATLLAARLAARRLPDPAARSGIRIATACGLALGALFFASDLSDALMRRGVIEDVDRRLAQRGATPGRIWYTGHWEVQFYGERKGWRPVIAGRSRLAAGDWLVIPAGVDQPRIDYPPHFERMGVVSAASVLPWSTIPAYYGTQTPLRRRQVTQVAAVVYRVTADTEPRSAAPKPPPK